MRKNIQIADLPAAAVELADDQLDIIAGAQRPESGFVCSALNGSSSGDCWDM
ncbi:hypothetical protein IL992_05180 [Microbispora sp. NEAU-D428]|uniref:hypothetical protein n=1 Tax=Microbispora TaxID=2005 RepID=UPI0018682E04|nr:hypothetical protein [Microbispora sitophila]MBE3008581.1 hypothetical protein [Microbispora sitophila]